MEKSELIKVVAQESGISEEETTKIFDCFINTIKEGLSRGEKVTIADFGTFSLAQRKAREFVNPKTKQVHSIPAKFLPFFKAKMGLEK
jgi:DNA-binding protein HU-beta